MDSCLTQPIPHTLPPWRKYATAPKIDGFTDITSRTPIVREFLGSMPDSEGQLQADDLFARVHELEGCGPCTVELVNKKKRKAYCKVTHLLDCIRAMQGYYADVEKGERRKAEKLNNPMNQAYVDCLANYLVGQLRERHLSPHFCHFYGGYQAKTKSYRYNITEEFESYRKYKSFWQKRKQGLFSLHVDTQDSDEKVSVHTPASSLHSMKFSYSTHKSTASTVSEEFGNELELTPIDVDMNAEMESVKSFDIASSVEQSDSESDSENEEEEEPEFYAELKDYPVMLFFQEEMEGVLDELLDDDEENEEEEENIKEKKWTAWCFQICAALCAAQGVLGMTHNDLHTNNIVWAETKEAFIFYKNRAGHIWRIPTFGKIFRIIDFGRSIFRVGEKWFISDDYAKGGDADSMYNFPEQGTMYREEKPIVYPNPSFDLARLAVSVIDALFSEIPDEKKDGLILSQEENWIIKETVSPLYNMLWSWIIDDSGCNILREENGDERFPDFDLYSHGAAHMVAGKPQDQISRDIFKQFRIEQKDIEEWELDGQNGQVYPLFF